MQRGKRGRAEGGMSSRGKLCAPRDRGSSRAVRLRGPSGRPAPLGMTSGCANWAGRTLLAHALPQRVLDLVDLPKALVEVVHQLLDHLRVGLGVLQRVAQG